MKTLQDILYRVPLEATIGNIKTPITTVCFDSRAVKEGAVFVALKGTQVDGHDFISKAIEKGAVAVVVEDIPTGLTDEQVVIQVDNAHKALSIMAANFYDNPSKKLELVGVTGTNGKTTVTSLLSKVFSYAGHKTGLISTVAITYLDQEYLATHTTPDPMVINKHLHAMVEGGVSHCFMEVSSHGIDQERTTGLHFSGGIFTNLTHDHLDYHGSFAEYRDVKKRFFDQLPASAFALLNWDDKNGAFMLQNTPAKKYSYALQNYADFQGAVLENQFQGMLLKMDNTEVWTTLVGSFNAANLLAVYGCGLLMGLDRMDLLQYVSKLQNVAGRFQTFESPDKVVVVVDYCHTPDALENVLQTINKIRTNNESLITVVGCGGNRDREKRPLMGEIAAKYSNKVIFTSDNPRDEDPELIIKQMVAGVAPEDYKKVLNVVSRREALNVAHHLSQPKDVILIAGKGHETYQEIKGERHPFDDYKIAQTIFLKKD